MRVFFIERDESSFKVLWRKFIKEFTLPQLGNDLSCFCLKAF